MKPISLIKRILFYLFLFGISLSGGLFAIFSGGREFGNDYFLICMYLIPQYIFGLIFLQTKLIIRFLMPLATTIVSIVIVWLIWKTVLFDTIDYVILFSLILFLPVIFIWEIAYQVLRKWGVSHR